MSIPVIEENYNTLNQICFTIVKEVFWTAASDSSSHSIVLYTNLTVRLTKPVAGALPLKKGLCKIYYKKDATYTNII